MKIDVLCNDGSPLLVTEQSVYGEDGRTGIGGAELALLTLCRAWHDAGHKVVLFNDAESGSVFEHRLLERFSPGAPRDVLIIFRSPNSRISRDDVEGLKVWWSCDQRTVGNFANFAGMVDKIVTISPFHDEYFKTIYNIQDTITIDLPVRIWEYDLETKKVPYKCIWNSIPDRGALQLAEVWKRVVEKVPEAHLVITSDWRLWTSAATPELLNPYRAAFASLPNVEYLGAVNRRELIRHELEAQVHINSNIYDELFCIAIAETQVAGAYPISSTTGAIRTTCMGTKIEGNPADATWQDACAEKVVKLLQNQNTLATLSREVQKKALQRFSLENILKQWDTKVFNG